MRKKSGFIPVSGSSSVGIGSFFEALVTTTVFFSGEEITVLPVFTITAHGLAAAPSLGFDFLSGLGVTNSRRAPAPSIIVAPEILIAA